MICSPILDVFNSSRGFCEHMGFKVHSPSQEEIDEENSTPPSKLCFNGIPRQLAEEGKVMRTDQQKQENNNQDYKAFIIRELEARLAKLNRSYAKIKRSLRRNPLLRRARHAYSNFGSFLARSF